MSSNGRKRNGKARVGKPQAATSRGNGERDPKSGKFLPGHTKLGGRERGTPDGIITVRKLIGKVLGEIAEPGVGDLEKFFEQVKKRGPKGAWWLYEHVYEPHAKRETAPPVDVPTSIVIVVGEGRA